MKNALLVWYEKRIAELLAILDELHRNEIHIDHIPGAIKHLDESPFKSGSKPATKDDK